MNANELMETTGDFQNDATQATQKAASKFQEKARAFQDSAKEWQRRAADSTRKAAQTTDAYVRDNPWTIVGCVAVACLAVGIVIGRSRD
jgi:ElaB/YqjD/DUF883 family membrane-anchored ribosome-binding protein